MKRSLIALTILLAAALALTAAIPAQDAQAGTDDAAITIYNQNFAVVRQSLALDLKSGVNDVRVSRAGFADPARPARATSVPDLRTEFSQ
jgi:hypothetical protein